MFFHRVRRVFIAYLKALLSIVMAFIICIALPIGVPLSYFVASQSHSTLFGVIGAVFLAFGIWVAWRHGRPMVLLVYWLGVEYLTDVHQEPWSIYRG